VSGLIDPLLSDKLKYLSSARELTLSKGAAKKIKK
jgi:hypothetical protein